MKDLVVHISNLRNVEQKVLETQVYWQGRAWSAEDKLKRFNGMEEQIKDKSIELSAALRTLRRREKTIERLKSEIKELKQKSGDVARVAAKAS